MKVRGSVFPARSPLSLLWRAVQHEKYTGVNSARQSGLIAPASRACTMHTSSAANSVDFESCKDEDVPTKACENRTIVVYVALQKPFFCIFSKLIC